MLGPEPHDSRSASPPLKMKESLDHPCTNTPSTGPQRVIDHIVNQFRFLCFRKHNKNKLSGGAYEMCEVVQ